MPLVSVVIPSYNHEKFIGQAINSVLKQSFQDFEVIITDDASMDGTITEIKKFNDPRIKLLINQSNQGAASALNNCIINSAGKYIAVLNSDDYWELSKLEKQVKFLELNPHYAGVFSQVEFVKENGEIYVDYNEYNWFNRKNVSRFQWLNSFFYGENHLAHPSALIRSRIYRELGLYNCHMALTPDFEMWVRVCLKYEIHVLQEKLLYFRILENEANESAVTITSKIRFYFEFGCLLDSFLRIESKEDLFQIFPGLKESFPLAKDSDINFLLGLTAVKSGLECAWQWGLKILYNVLHNNKFPLYYKENFSFSNKELFNLNKFKDIYNIEIKEALTNSLDKKDIIVNLNKSIALRNEEMIRIINLLNKKIDKIIELKALLNSKNQELARLHEENISNGLKLARITTSYSWKLTKPLRIIYKIWKKLIKIRC